jgi:hypothetical protein
VSSTTEAELGVKFRVEKAGFITGVRFYRGPADAGPYEASLRKAASTDPWNDTTMTGQLLATGSVTSGSSSGWQEVVFATPMAVQPDTLYFAGYYAPFGQYAADAGYFRDREIVHSPVRLPSQGSIDGNGFIRVGGRGLPAPFTTSGGTTGYSNTGLQAGTTYRCRVVATNAGGESPPSAVATATTPAAVDTIPPTAPTGLKVASPKGKVNLSWTGSTDTGGSGLAGYRIWRSTTGASGSFAVVGTTAGTLFTDSTVVAKLDYWCQVTAYEVAGNQSHLSNVALASSK